MTNRIEIYTDEEWKRAELQQFSDVLNMRISFAGELEGGFEQCVFTPKAWVENEKHQPKLFEDEEK